MINAEKVIAGAADAESFIDVLRICLTGGDELYDRLRSMADDDRLRGFARTLQKHLERAR